MGEPGLHVLANYLPWMVVAGSFIGGYAVLQKRVKDLEDAKPLSIEKHKDLCQISKLEMKKHVTDTFVEFDSEKFQPAIKEILKEIKNGRPNT